MNPIQPTTDTMTPTEKFNRLKQRLDSPKQRNTQPKNPTHSPESTEQKTAMILIPTLHHRERLDQLDTLIQETKETVQDIDQIIAEESDDPFISDENLMDRLDELKLIEHLDTFPNAPISDIPTTSLWQEIWAGDYGQKKRNQSNFSDCDTIDSGDLADVSETDYDTTDPKGLTDEPTDTTNTPVFDDSKPVDIDLPLSDFYAPNEEREQVITINGSKFLIKMELPVDIDPTEIFNIYQTRILPFILQEATLDKTKTFTITFQDQTAQMSLHQENKVLTVQKPDLVNALQSIYQTIHIKPKEKNASIQFNTNTKNPPSDLTALTPSAGTKPIGFQNPTRTSCWLNSVIQSLYSAPFIRKEILTTNLEPLQNDEKKLWTALQTLFKQYQEASLNSHRNPSSLDTNEVKNALLEAAPNFQHNQYNDAVEAFQHILEKLPTLSKKLTRRLDEKIQEDVNLYTAAPDPIIPINFLNPVEENSGLQATSTNYLQFLSPEAPQPPLICFDRRNELEQTRLLTPITVPLLLTSPNQHSSDKPYQYELTSFIDQTGSDQTGHYTSYVRESSQERDKFFSINDDVVREVTQTVFLDKATTARFWVYSLKTH